MKFGLSGPLLIEVDNSLDAPGGKETLEVSVKGTV